MQKGHFVFCGLKQDRNHKWQFVGGQTVSFHMVAGFNGFVTISFLSPVTIHRLLLQHFDASALKW